MKNNRVLVSPALARRQSAAVGVVVAAAALEVQEFSPTNYLLGKLDKFRSKADGRWNYYFPEVAEGTTRSVQQMVTMFAAELAARGLEFGTSGYATGSPFIGVFYAGDCVGFFDVVNGSGFITIDLDQRLTHGTHLRVVDGEGAQISFDNSYYDYELLRKTLSLHEKLLAKNVDIEMKVVRAGSEIELGGMINTLATNFPANMDLSLFTPRFVIMFKKYMQDLSEAMATLKARN